MKCNASDLFGGAIGPINTYIETVFRNNPHPGYQWYACLVVVRRQYYNHRVVVCWKSYRLPRVADIQNLPRLKYFPGLIHIFDGNVELLAVAQRRGT